MGIMFLVWVCGFVYRVTEGLERASGVELDSIPSTSPLGCLDF